MDFKTKFSLLGFDTKLLDNTDVFAGVLEQYERPIENYSNHN